MSIYKKTNLKICQFGLHIVFAGLLLIFCFEVNSYADDPDNTQKPAFSVEPPSIEPKREEVKADSFDNKEVSSVNNQVNLESSEAGSDLDKEDSENSIESEVPMDFVNPLEFDGTPEFLERANKYAENCAYRMYKFAKKNDSVLLAFMKKQAKSSFNIILNIKGDSVILKDVVDSCVKSNTVCCSYVDVLLDYGEEVTKRNAKIAFGVVESTAEY